MGAEVQGSTLCSCVFYRRHPSIDPQSGQHPVSYTALLTTMHASIDSAVANTLLHMRDPKCSWVTDEKDVWERIETRADVAGGCKLLYDLYHAHITYVACMHALPCSYQPVCMYRCIHGSIRLVYYGSIRLVYYRGCHFVVVLVLQCVTCCNHTFRSTTLHLRSIVAHHLRPLYSTSKHLRLL